MDLDRLDRREFVILSGAVLVQCGLAATAAAAPSSAPSATPSPGSDIIDAGPLTQYTATGAYDAFANYEKNDANKFKAFFIVHRDGVLYALSAICPHKGCVVQKQSDNSFECPCHQSTFSPAGKVDADSKAKTDLPRLAVKRDANDHLLVDVRRPLPNPG